LPPPRANLIKAKSFTLKGVAGVNNPNLLSPNLHQVKRP
jgi:hypothetical protein